MCAIKKKNPCNSQINKNTPVILQLLRRIYKCGKKWKKEARLVSPVAYEPKLTWVVTMGACGTQPFTDAKSSPTQEPGVNTSKFNALPCRVAWLGFAPVWTWRGAGRGSGASTFALRRWVAEWPSLEACCAALQGWPSQLSENISSRTVLDTLWGLWSSCLSWWSV